MSQASFDRASNSPFHDTDASPSGFGQIFRFMTMPEWKDSQALKEAWSNLLSLPEGKQRAELSEMTVKTFVETKFVPEHVALKEVSGRIHYQAILRHVLTPEEVDTAFAVIPKGSRKLLEPVPGWPYLSNMRLCDVQPEDVQRLTSVAFGHGYSHQTVKHIRNVVSAIFSHAQRVRCYLGENPVKSAKLPKNESQGSPSLNSVQIKEALRAMDYPEREMAIMAVFANMNPAEISGLQWKQVNLTKVAAQLDSARIPPYSIAITQHKLLGALERVREGRIRVVPIPQPLYKVLVKLKERPDFTGPDDFVLVTRSGEPVNAKDLVARRLRPIAKRLGLPSLTLQSFRRASKGLMVATWARI